MQETDGRGEFQQFLEFPMEADSRQVAAREGWILGVK